MTAEQQQQQQHTTPSPPACHGRPLLWTVKIEFPNATVDATAGISQNSIKEIQNSNSTKPPSLGQCMSPKPLNGKLRMLRQLKFDSVPSVLLTSTALALYINSADNDDHSRRYINGLINLLLPPQTMAVLTLVEIAGNSDAIMLGMNDPFANPQAKSSSAISPPWLLAGNCSYALVYLMNSPDSSDPRLVLHLLASPKHGIESLAASATWALRSGAEAKAGELLRLINDNMDCERAFIDLFAKKNHAEKQARIQRTMSTESMVLANSTVAASNAPSQKARLHRGKVITLSDIEQFASSSTTEQPDTEEIDAEEVEQANKKLAKQLIITSLKERGVSRDHADFAALWSQIYRSLKFALRDQIAKRKYSVRELKAEANKHTAFYCSS